MPRVLRGVGNRSMAMTALGYNLSAPFGIAPTAMQKMAHEDGELATAKGLLLWCPDEISRQLLSWYLLLYKSRL